MPNRSVVDALNLVYSLEVDSRTTNNTTVAGAAVDTQGYDAITVIVPFGDWGDTTTGGIEVALQHSDDTVSGNFVDVPDADMTDTITGTSTVSGASTTGVFARVDAAAEDDTIYKTGYLGNKRYVRTKLAATGNQSGGYEMGTIVMRSRASLQPVS